MTASEIAQRLNAKRSGEGWKAKCLAHEDRIPSLRIKEGSDGRVLLHCFAGCSFDNILHAIGLERRDLFPSVSQAAATEPYPHGGPGGGNLGLPDAIPVSYAPTTLKPTGKLVRIRRSDLEKFLESGATIGGAQ